LANVWRLEKGCSPAEPGVNELKTYANKQEKTRQALRETILD
jgi:hypothetical protein